MSRSLLVIFLLISTFNSYSANDTLAGWNTYKAAKQNTKAGNLANAIKQFTEAAHILLNSSSCLYAYSLFSLSEIYKSKGDFISALKIIRNIETSQFNKTTASYELQLEFLNRLGSLMFLTGNTEGAINTFETATKKIIGFEKKYPKSAYKIYNNYASVLEKENKFQLSLHYYIKAISITNKLKSKDISLAYLNQNIAKIYLFIGMPDSSRYYFNNSISISQNLLANDETQLGMFYLNTGLFYKNIGILENAMKYYRKAENLLIKKLSKNDARLDALYANMGSIYLLQGDYEHAIEYFNKSYLIFFSNKSNDILKKITLLKNMLNVYLYTSDYLKAKEIINDILEISPKNTKELRVEIPYNLIARYYVKIGQLKQAEEYYLANLEQMKRIYGENSPSCASAYMNLGQFYLSAKQSNLIKANLLKAHQIYQLIYGANHQATTQSLITLGTYYLTVNDFNSAITKFQEALKIFKIDIDHNESIGKLLYQSNGYEISILNLLRKLGIAYLKKAENEKNPEKYYLKALKSLESAISFSFMLQSGYITEESKLFIAGDQQNTLIKAINTSVKLYELTKNKEYLIKAFDFTGKSKSFVLFSAIRDMEAKMFSNIPQELLLKEKQADEDIAIFRELIIKEQQKNVPDLKMIEKWQSKVFELVKLKELLIDDYKKRYPVYYNSKFQHENISVKKVMKKLKRKESLIEYFFSDTALITFYIDKHNFMYNKIKTDSSFYAQTEWILKFLAAGNTTDNISETYSQFNTFSYNLYTKLLGQFSKYYKNNRLIIIPDNILAFLPFEILITQKLHSHKADYRKLSYLINYNILRYSYSTSLAFTKFKREKRTNNKILAIAPEYGNNNNLNPEKELALREYKNILVPLKGVEEEVFMVKKKTNAKVLIDDEATEKNFKKLAPSYGILHLAMHTIIDNEKPLYSKLVFSFNNDTIDDGMLNTYELYNIKLNAKLAVLSACNTGFGRLQKGEGVMSLARGFIYAGCPNIIMTLWALEDKAGLSVMSEFYKFLKKGLQSDVAIAKAKRKFLEQSDILKSHPYFWAGYVCIGSHSAIFGYRLLIIAVIISLSAIIVILIIFFRKRRKTII